MAKTNRPKKGIDPAELESLARSGLGRAQLAKHFQLSYTGFCSRLDREPELREAFDCGTRLAFEDLASELRRIALDPEEKTNNRVQAADKLLRHTEVDRTKQLQSSLLSHMTNDELAALAETAQRKELQSRLGVKAPVHDESEPTTEPLKVIDHGV